MNILCTTDIFSQLDFIIKICFFMSNRFPYIALVVLVALAVMIALKERRRKLLLSASKESEAIDQMQNNGEITKEQANDLKRAANPLPEVTEEYPLPDLHLRLASSLTMAFNVLKILLVLSNIFIFSMIFHNIKQFSDKPGIQTTYHADKPWVLVIMLSTIVILSIIQIIAAFKITRGSLKSRYVITFLWFIDLVFLGAILSGTDNITALAVSVGACSYTVWVFFLRKQAGKFISTSAKDESNSIKYSIVGLIIAALFIGQYFIKSEIKYKFITTGSQTVCTSTLSSGSRNNCSSLNRVAIITYDNDSGVIQFANELYKKLKKQFPLLKFAKLKTGKSFPDGTIKFDQYIIVSKAKVILPKESELPDDLPDFIKNQILKDIEGIKSNSLDISRFIKKGNMTGFNIDIISESQSHSYENYNSTVRLYNGDYIDGRIFVSCNSSNENPPFVIKQCLDKALPFITKAYKSSLNNHPRMLYPDFLMPKLTPTAPTLLPRLSGAWMIGRFRSKSFSNFTLQLLILENDRNNQLERIKKQLVTCGWKQVSTDRRPGEYFFTRTGKEYDTPMITLYLPKNNNDSTLFGTTPKIEEKFGHLIYTASNTRKYNKTDADKLKKFDMTTYIHCVNLSELIENKEIYQYAINEKNIKYGTLKWIYSNLKKKLSNVQKDAILTKMYTVLVQHESRDDFPNKLQDFINILLKDTRYPIEHHPALGKLKQHLKRITLLKQPDTVPTKYNFQQKLQAPNQANILIIKSPAIPQTFGIYIVRVKKLIDGSNELSTAISAVVLDKTKQFRNGGVSQCGTRQYTGDIRGYSEQVNISGQGIISTSSGKWIKPRKGCITIKNDYTAKDGILNLTISYVDQK